MSLPEGFLIAEPNLGNKTSVTFMESIKDNDEYQC